jgi:hypothetical protein
MRLSVRRQWAVHAAREMVADICRSMKQSRSSSRSAVRKGNLARAHDANRPSPLLKSAEAAQTASLTSSGGPLATVVIVSSLTESIVS